MRAAMMAAVPLVLATAAAAEPFAYTIVDAAAVPAPLGGFAGNPRRGAEVFTQACAACHAAPALAAGVPGALRLAVIDLSVLKPDASGHAFYDPDAEGRTLLPARSIEDIVAYLGSRAATAAP